MWDAAPTSTWTFGLPADTSAGASVAPATARSIPLYGLTLDVLAQRAGVAVIASTSSFAA